MKTKILLLLLLSLAILSCEESVSFSGNPEEIAISNEGGFYVFSFKSNRSWTAKSSESWCAIYPASGNRSDKSLTVSVGTNETSYPRTSIVTVKGRSVSKTLTINQSANSVLLVTQEKFDLNNDAATIEVEVQANVDYDVYISEDWITQVNSRSLTSYKYTFNIAKNISYNKRYGTITIRQKNGSLERTIRVYQS